MESCVGIAPTMTALQAVALTNLANRTYRRQAHEECTYPLDHRQSSFKAIGIAHIWLPSSLLSYSLSSSCLYLFFDLSLPTLTSWSPQFVFWYESPYEFTLSRSQPDFRAIALSFLRNKLLRQLVEYVLYSLRRTISLEMVRLLGVEPRAQGSQPCILSIKL